MIATLFLVIPALVLVGWTALMLVRVHRRDLRAEREFDETLTRIPWSRETSAVTVLRAVPADDDLDVPNWPALRPARSEHPSTGEAS